MNNKLLVLIGLFIFIIVLSRVEIENILAIISKADLNYFALALLVFAIMLLLKGIKWKYILASQGTNISVLKATKYFTIGFFFSSFTPGRIGDFARAVYVAKNQSLTKALASVFLDRLIDISILISFALLGSLILTSTITKAGFELWPFFTTAVFFFLAVFLLLKEKYIKKLLKPFYLIFVPDNAKEVVSKKFSEFLSAVKQFPNKKKELVMSLFAGIIFWLLTIFFAQFLAHSIGAKLSYEETLVLYSIISLTDIIPITVSGIGTREAVSVVFFSFLGIESELAIAFSLLLFTTSYLTTAFIGYLSFTTEPIDLKKWQKS